MIKKYKVFVLILVSALLPQFTYAHQPRLVESREINVIDPEISKAYYGKLVGVPDTYTIRSDKDFDLYVNILVPYIDGQKKDISVRIIKDNVDIANLNEVPFNWERMFEPFGYDTYWKGPEYKSRTSAGTYTIIVSNPNNDSKYSLAIGEAENFNFEETLNALTIIPKLKKDFFNESPINFILSPFGWGLIVILYLASAIFGLLYRFILKIFFKNTIRGADKNIGYVDRLIRLLIGLGLLLLTISTSWNPILIFLSGFAIFEAIFSWCELYAALGRNTCPIL